MCKHIEAITCRDRGMPWHDSAKDVPLGENRKKGRPAKNKDALNSQPIETLSHLENEVAGDELSFIIEFEDEQEPATENGQNLQEQVVAPTTSNEQTNEQLNIVHGVFESEPSVLNLVENCPAKRSRGRSRKNPISDQIKRGKVEEHTNKPHRQNKKKEKQNIIWPK
ncbi:hypothetical protein BpHYR1_028522 [Brachionus plicatilis]|uniref:Uncharacterized protein n=1 Tax=Brachionus plicatilis TaxID=10195 RepID=A0A3M7RBW5_BRAPC|nr:hypothetical protein BpHYR1_028522 [Brachionus plicatilis]